MDKYGLIGFPLGHSLSKDFFNNKFESEGIAAEYENFEIPDIKELRAVLLTNPTLKGFNVTIPYKEQIIPYLQEMTKEAKAIGAVNVVKVMRKGKKTRLKGFNSDVVGFVESIRPLLERYHEKALVLGTGGVSKAVGYGLRMLGLETLFVSRRKRAGVVTYDELTEEVVDGHKVIVNCTPVGMFPNIYDCPALPYSAVGSQHLLYDTVYNPDATMFLTKGKERGAMTKSGIEMLLLQAIKTWEFWNE